MNTFTKLVVCSIVAIVFSNLHGQEKSVDSIRVTTVSSKIQDLIKLKTTIEREEREFLKLEIKAINDQLDNNKITAAKAEELKKEAAKKRAANIENKHAIIEHKIALLNRNGAYYNSEHRDEANIVLRVGSGEDSNDSFIYFGEKSQDKPRKYDRRTTTDVVFALGFNNALIEGENLEDSPYKIGGSGFIELGYSWKTRIFDNTNFWRLKYGFSFQWNKFDVKDNNYFVNTEGNISLEKFPIDLNKTKFRTTNLVFPVYLEFGPSKKIEKENYFRYSTRNQLKIGLGGYAGLNIGSMQKLKYKEEGDRIKIKQRGGFETSDFVYGVGGYLALGDTALYIKYDLNPLFKNQTVDQNNISVGVRFDMD